MRLLTTALLSSFSNPVFLQIFFVILYIYLSLCLNWICIRVNLQILQVTFPVIGNKTPTLSATLGPTLSYPCILMLSALLVNSYRPQNYVWHAIIQASNVVGISLMLLLALGLVINFQLSADLALTCHGSFLFTVDNGRTQEMTKSFGGISLYATGSCCKFPIVCRSSSDMGWLPS